ncbi:MAG: PAS domain-containing sensor histidine kinase, partial [Phycisphaerales bacterium]|nr:PAS domain-containing sensor histidine kinase [Phycisphaerales bacterium]
MERLLQQIFSDGEPHGRVGGSAGDLAPGAPGASEASGRRTRAALMAADAGTWSWNLVTNRDTRDAALNRMLGLKAEESSHAAEGYFSHVHADDVDRLHAAVDRARATNGTFNETYRVVRPDGEARWVNDRGRVFADAQGRPALMTGLMVDVTDEHESSAPWMGRQQAEMHRAAAETAADVERPRSRLRQTERLAGLGTLAAGLGHDIANILFPIRCRLDALESSGLPEAARAEIREIRGWIEHLDDLNGTLRMLAVDPGRTPTLQRSTRLAGWWRKAGPLLARALPSHVPLSAEIGETLPPVRLDESHLTQAVLNLVMNAADASPPPELRPIVLTAHAADGGAFVELVVRDAGVGMSREVASQAMSPSYSTKPRGIGTGMGLPIAEALLRG